MPRKEPEVKTPALTQSKEKRAKVPAHVFLLPEERKFPYKRWRNGRWVISCADLRDAIRLAAIHGYRKVRQKAEELYVKHCGKKKS